MIDKEIFKIANQLQEVANRQMSQAKKALEDLPKGDTRKDLEGLLRRASAGKVTQDEAQKEVDKIIGNAS